MAVLSWAIGLAAGAVAAACTATPAEGEADASPAASLYDVAFQDFQVTYQTSYPVGENLIRDLPVRVWYPLDFGGRASTVVVSHGGTGSLMGHTNFEHIARELAAHGYLSVHVGHIPSTNELYHRVDRPADVSAVLDALRAGAIVPAAFAGEVDAEAVGHLGHSWGAYTTHAVAGAEFTSPIPNDPSRWSFRDARVHAIVALSPQGWDQFGSFDEQHDIALPSNDNSWQAVAIPAYTLVGELEKDGVAGVEDGIPGTFRTEDWRLFPFARYPADGHRYASIIPGQRHSDLGGGASDEVNAYVSANARVFFDVYLRGLVESEGDIGRVSMLPNIDNRHR